MLPHPDQPGGGFARPSLRSVPRALGRKTTKAPRDMSRLLSGEKREQLAHHGVSVSATGLAFARELDEDRLRTIWAAVSAVRRRTGNADWTNWLVGDWANEAMRRLAEGAAYRL